VMPFTIDLEHKIEVGARCGGGFLMGTGRGRCVSLRSTVEHRLRKISAEVHVSVFAFARDVTGEPVRRRGVVEKPVTKIGVLRSRAAQDIENVAVEGPGAKSLRHCSTEQCIPGAGAGMELGIEELPLVVDAIGYARGRLHAEEDGRFGLGLFVKEKPVLPKKRHIAEPRGAAAIDDDRVERIGGVAFTNSSATDPWYPHAYREVMGHAVGNYGGDTFDRFQIMHTFVAGNGGARERLIAQGPKADVFEHHADGGLSLIEGARRNGENWSGSARV